MFNVIDFLLIRSVKSLIAIEVPHSSCSKPGYVKLFFRSQLIVWAISKMTFVNAIKQKGNADSPNIKRDHIPTYEKPDERNERPCYIRSLGGLLLRALIFFRNSLVFGHRLLSVSINYGSAFSLRIKEISVVLSSNNLKSRPLGDVFLRRAS